MQNGMMLGRGNPGDEASTHLFLIGRDYHLGDLLWFTAVLAEFRKQVRLDRVLVALPDRPFCRILEHNPLIDELLYGEPTQVLWRVRQAGGSRVAVHDLRPFAVGVEMVRQCRYRLPWKYYRDLWFEGRGQWLATFLRLGPLTDFRPVLRLTQEDRVLARSLPPRYVLFAPHIGHYALPFAGRFWQRMKSWGKEHWIALADLFQQRGYQPVTLAGAGQDPVPGTMALIDHPIRQVAGVVDQATALITVESGLWYIAAACRTPFVIVPWWLPRSIDWPGWMRVPHRLIDRKHASVDNVLSNAFSLLDRAAE